MIFCMGRCFLAITLFAALLSQVVGRDNRAPLSAPHHPSRRIDLTEWGYSGFSPLVRFGSKANLTLDFVDAQHVLLTFDAKRLMKRHPECPPTHADRTIHALVLDLASGKSVQETDWYVHDDRPYLWPLGEGRFLLRRLNRFYEVDAQLKESLVLESSHDVLWASTTPDAKQIILETAEDTSASGNSAHDQSRRPRVRIDVLDASSLNRRNTLRAADAVEFEAASSGYAESSRSALGKVWQITFGPNPDQRRSLARVRSPCKPDLLFPSDETLLIGRCSAKSTGYSVSLFSLGGQPLWRDKWNDLRHDPSVARNQDGSRFAVGTTVPNSDETKRAPELDDPVGWPDVQQEIRVFETASGHTVLTAKVKSVILKNRSFALSPDGSCLAVVDAGELRLYNLPDISPEERAQYLAVRANAPGLSAPAADSNAEADEGLSGAQANDEDVELQAPGLDAASERPPGAQNEATGSVSEPDSAGTLGSRPNGQGSTVTPAAETFRAHAEEVVIDVVITDSKGHPAKGLTPSNFRIEEDGKPQTIGYLHEFGGSFRAAPTPAAAMRPNVFTNQVAAQPDQAKVVLLLDFLNTPFADQQYTKQELLKFLKNKPAGTPLALCVLTDRLQMIQGFTTDENLLLANADSKKSHPRFSLDVDRRDSLNDVIKQEKQVAEQKAYVEMGVQHLTHFQAQDRAMQLDRRMSATVDAFGELARYLSGVPGRKSVIWLSGSIPSGFFGNQQLNWDTTDAIPETRSYGERLREATNLLAEAHVAVYPVDVRGVTNDSVFEAANRVDPIGAGAPGSQQQGPPGRALVTPMSGTNTAMALPPSTPLQNEFLQQHQGAAFERMSMDEVAEQTGGKAFYGNRIQQAIATAVEQGSSYYLLSYVPSNRRYDGTLRKIKISLNAKGYSLAYRHSYYSVDPQSPRQPPENSRAQREQAMLRDAPQSHQILFAIRIRPTGKVAKASLQREGTNSGDTSSAKKSAMQHYSVDYAVSAPQVNFGTSGDRRRAVLDFLISASDEHGTVLAQTGSQTTVDLGPASYRDAMLGGLRMHQEVDVPITASALRLGVVDEQSHRIGTLDVPLPVKAPPDEASVEARKVPIEPN